MKKIRELEKQDIQYWPDIRWRMAEGFHTDQTLKSEIRSLHEAGFGTVEFLAMEEQGVDSSIYGWGSEEWNHDTHTIVQETTNRNMGVSMTSGTNWSNANLITITPDDRAAPAIGEAVSGIGYYTVEVELPENWSEECGALLQIGSLNKHTAAVYVNDKKARVVDIDRLSVDISEWLHAGKNKILIEVSTSLNNRLRERNYYESGNAASQELAANSNNALEVTEDAQETQETSSDSMFHITAKVRDYGMTGEVKLRTYRKFRLL